MDLDFQFGKLPKELRNQSTHLYQLDVLTRFHYPITSICTKLIVKSCSLSGMDDIVIQKNMLRIHLSLFVTMNSANTQRKT